MTARRFWLRFSVACGSPKWVTPLHHVAPMTVEVSEQTYRAWWHKALNIKVAADFTEPLDNDWWVTNYGIREGIGYRLTGLGVAGWIDEWQP
jgi:hypothetical protein